VRPWLLTFNFNGIVLLETMKLGGKYLLGRAVPKYSNLMEMDEMRESLSKRVAQGLSVDLALISILVLIPVCVVVLTLLRYFIIGRERGLIVVHLSTSRT
jgi:hypothetical protein